MPNNLNQLELSLLNHKAMLSMEPVSLLALLRIRKRTLLKLLNALPPLDTFTRCLVLPCLAPLLPSQVNRVNRVSPCNLCILIILVWPLPLLAWLICRPTWQPRIWLGTLGCPQEWLQRCMHPRECLACLRILEQLIQCIILAVILGLNLVNSPRSKVKVGNNNKTGVDPRCHQRQFLLTLILPPLIGTRVHRWATLFHT